MHGAWCRGAGISYAMLGPTLLGWLFADWGGGEPALPTPAIITACKVNDEMVRNLGALATVVPEVRASPLCSTTSNLI